MNKSGIIIASMTALVLAPLVAGAQPLSRSNYEDELQRCVSQIRAESGASGKLRHYVRDVERARLWYRFEIETLGADSNPALTVCRAYRFQDRVLLDAPGPGEARSESRLARAR